MATRENSTASGGRSGQVDLALSIAVARLWDPESAGRLVGEGGEDHLFDAHTPEFAGDYGSVGHATAGLDAGDKDGGTGLVGDPVERALGEGEGDGRVLRRPACRRRLCYPCRRRAWRSRAWRVRSRRCL